MKDPGAIAAAEALIACDPDVASATDLSEMSRNAAALRAFADYVDVRVNRRSNELAAAGEADTGAHALIDDGRLTGKGAKATGGSDRVCTEMPQFDEALAAGTTGHIDALAHLTKDLSTRNEPTSRSSSMTSSPTLTSSRCRCSNGRRGR